MADLAPMGLGGPCTQTSPAATDDHAVKVLYPAIKAAMAELESLHPDFNDAVNRAYNHLHGAFWSECPAPVGAPGLRPTTFPDDFALGKACDPASLGGACEACQ